MILKKLPTGVQDILPRECRALASVREKLTRAFESRGYDPVLSAAVEYYDTYAGIRNALPQERMFKFTDQDGKLLVLRPDATLSISRIAATKLTEPEARLYYFLDKWDAQSAGGVRTREIFQAGIERLGEEGAFSDAQTIAFAIDCMHEAGLADCILDIGHVGFMKGLLEECGLTDAQAEEVRASLNAVEKELPPRFSRCHRAYIVNRACVERLDMPAMTLYLSSGERLPVSRSCKEALREGLRAEGKA